MTVVVFKAITPKKLKIDGFRLEILNELRKEGTTHRQILARTTTTWKDRPTFKSDISLDRRTGAGVHTYPTGSEMAVNKWVWTDQGTKPHTIRARRAPTLRFQTGYTAKTKKRTYTSGQSSRFGPWVRPLSVKHPGTEAREWSEDLSARRQKPFEDRIRGAMKRAANKAF